jgi:hypothetical protein
MEPDITRSNQNPGLGNLRGPGPLCCSPTEVWVDKHRSSRYVATRLEHGRTKEPTATNTIERCQPPCFSFGGKPAAETSYSMEVYRIGWEHGRKGVGDPFSLLTERHGRQSWSRRVPRAGTRKAGSQSLGGPLLSSPERHGRRSLE